MGIYQNLSNENKITWDLKKNITNFLFCKGFLPLFFVFETQTRTVGCDFARRIWRSSRSCCYTCRSGYNNNREMNSLFQKRTTIVTIIFSKLMRMWLWWLYSLQNNQTNVGFGQDWSNSWKFSKKLPSQF